MNHAVSIFPVSQRRACALLEQPRSTQRLSPRVPSDCEQTLRARLRELAAARPRFGYRRLHAFLVREGFGVNHKRVQRLCRDEGLRVSLRVRVKVKVRVKKRKRARLGKSTNPQDGLSAARPNHVWALDFQFDQPVAVGC